MFDARNNLSGQVVADVRQFMGDKVYETVIPRNVRVSEAPSYGKPVLLYDLKCARQPGLSAGSRPKSSSASERCGPRESRRSGSEQTDGRGTQPADGSAAASRR